MRLLIYYQNKNVFSDRRNRLYDNSASLRYDGDGALILFIQTLALYKSFTYLLTYYVTCDMACRYSDVCGIRSVSGGYRECPACDHWSRCSTQMFRSARWFVVILLGRVVKNKGEVTGVILL